MTPASPSKLTGSKNTKIIGQPSIKFLIKFVKTTLEEKESWIFVKSHKNNFKGIDYKLHSIAFIIFFTQSQNKISKWI